MIPKKHIIILVVVLCALPGFARAADNRTFNRFYNLSPKEFEEQISYYDHHNWADSATLCANVQASKYGKGKLSLEEINACCFAYLHLSNDYIYHFCDYQAAAENLLKAEQIADRYGLKKLQIDIAVNKAAFAANKNDIENNFAFNRIVLNEFRNAFYRTFDQVKSYDTESSKAIMELAVSNLLYYAIKFDKTKEVMNEVQIYSQAQKRYGTSCNIAELFCQAVVFYNDDKYEKAFNALETPLSCPDYFINNDSIVLQSMAIMAQSIVLCKNGKRSEALKLLLQYEQFMRENNMSFEQLEALQLIKQHYEVDGNDVLANKYALLYYTTKDEFINKSRVGKMDQAKLNLELEQTREHIREMSYRQKMQSLLLWSSIIIALLALTILGVLYANYRKTKRTNRLLYEKNIALLNEGKDLRPATAEVPEKTSQEEPAPADMELMEKITALMESSPEVFTEAFSLNRLAELLGSNSKYVSRAINLCKQCNFSVLLNEYRIKEACRRLINAEEYGNYTIEGIANSVGYKSRSNFTTIFKENVGLTPSAFQKLSQNGENTVG